MKLKVLCQLEQEIFSELDSISKEFYKHEIKDVVRKEQIQVILNRATAQVKLK